MDAGGAPEGVLGRCCFKMSRWRIQGKLLPQNDEERKRCKEMGVDVNQVLYMDDLVKGDDAIFAATGITDGELLKGVQFIGGHAYAQLTPSLCVLSQEPFVLSKVATVWQKNHI